MLLDISITNLGVIPHAQVEFSPGLTVLTGETGAGKTMVVTGLRLLSGGKADSSKVRTGSDQAVVEGVFAVDEDDTALMSAIAETGAQADDSGDGHHREYVAARSVKATGRSRAHLGGRTVPAGTLGEITSRLLTIHGQNDQLRLLAPAEQLGALDAFAPEIEAIRDGYVSAWSTWRELAKDLRQRTEQRRELEQEVDRLRFAVDEINAVEPVAGEDEELIATIKRLQDVDALHDAATLALTALDGDPSGGGYGEEEPASTLIGHASGALSSSSDEALKELGERLSEVASELSDISGELGRYLAGLPSDPGELDTLLTRQQELKTLTRKYAPDIDGVLAWRDKALARLDKIDTSAEAVEKLAAAVRDAEKQMAARAKKLTAARTRAANDLEKAVTAELRGLAMPKARIAVVVEPREPGPDGADVVELRLAPNATAEPQPLATSASGGELSRVMLALEVVLSTHRSGHTMVFDEVDAGVGGRAAVEIGKRLARLARRNQVIVVTHLPQVAAYADAHLHVSKNVGDSSVTSGVVQLSDEERVEELARMLAGMEDSETGRAHAKELLEKARVDVRETEAAENPKG